MEAIFNCADDLAMRWAQSSVYTLLTRTPLAYSVLPHYEPRRIRQPSHHDAAFRAVLRVSAHSMLQDDLEQAKFGWSHCLNLPQSAFGLSSVTTNRKLALAAALAWIVAYRSVLSDRALDFARRSGTSARPRRLTTYPTNALLPDSNKTKGVPP
jgi:hypothetical protein